MLDAMMGTNGTQATTALLQSGLVRPGAAVVLASDDFTRSDRNITGDAAPGGGYKYRHTGSVLQQIINHKLVMNANVGTADIEYIDTGADIPTAVLYDFFLDGGAATLDPIQMANIVCGTSSANGFGQGSIQLAIYPTFWILFVVVPGTPITYPTLATGTFAVPLSTNPLVRQHAELHYDSVQSQITVILPDATTVTTATDPLINTSWGSLTGFQLRRPNVGAGGGGFFAWAIYYNPVKFPQPIEGAGMSLAGADFASTPDPGWVPGDIDVRVLCAPLLWTGFATNQSVMAQYSRLDGDHCYNLQLNTNGRPQLQVSLDGSDILTGATATVALPFAANQMGWLRATRVAASGDITYYWSPALDGVNWTALGAVVASLPGAPFNSSAPIQSGMRAQANGFSGVIMDAQLFNGGVLVAELPLTGAFYGVDSKSNRWSVTSTAAWSVPTIRTLSTQHVLKGGAAQVFNNSTVMADITGLGADGKLSVTVPANATMLVDFVLICDGDAGADLKVRPVIPGGGATVDAWVLAGSVAMAAAGSGTGQWIYVDETVGSAGISIGVAAAGTKTVTILRCHVTTGATPGQVSMQAAQNLAVAANCSIYPRSYVTATRLA